MPSLHTSRLVIEMLTDVQLFSSVKYDMANVALRLKTNRLMIVDAFNRLGCHRYDYLSTQEGNFSLMNLTPKQCDQLVKEHHVYIPSCGRVVISNINSKNVE